MKIVLISNSSWNLYNFRIDLIRNLNKNNHEVYILTSKDKYSEYLKQIGCKHISLSISQYGKNLLRESLTIYKIYKELKTINPKYVLSFTIKPNLYSSIICKKLGIKNISNITGLGNTFIEKKLTYFLTIFLYRAFLSSSYMIFFQNNDDLKIFKKLNIIKKNNYDIIPGSGVNLNYFSCSNTNTKKNINFLFIGRLIKAKGIDEFCEAATNIIKKNNNINFNILSPTSENYLIYKNKYKLINFLDSTEDTRIFLKKTECVVLPSYREGMPRSLLEACAMNVPVIGSNVPGCRDIIFEGYNGLLCDKGSVKSLEEAMIKFIKMPKSNKLQMSKNARNLVEEKFDVNIVIKRYNKLIK